MKKLFTLLYCIAISNFIFAQNIKVDSTFGENGVAKGVFGYGNSFGRAVAVQSDGKIVESFFDPGASFQSCNG